MSGGICTVRSKFNKFEHVQYRLCTGDWARVLYRRGPGCPVQRPPNEQTNRHIRLKTIIN